MTYKVTSREALEKAIKHAIQLDDDVTSASGSLRSSVGLEEGAALAGLWVAIAAELREQSNPRR